MAKKSSIERNKKRERLVKNMLLSVLRLRH